ncbi:MAG: CHC2 zinc finger domain-containing protein [bacterium]
MKPLKVLSNSEELYILFQELYPQSIKKGKHFQCPFHEDKNPSLSIYQTSDDQAKYHCFGCRENGNAITLVMRKNNCEYVEALSILAKRECIELKDVDIAHIKETKKRGDLYEKLGDYFKENLITHPSGERTRNWLIKRGIPNDVWAKLPIGLYPGEAETKNFCNKLGMPDDLMNGFLRRRQDWNGSTVFIYYNDFTRISRFKLRIPETKETIFLGKSGTKSGGDSGFFGLNFYTSQNTLKNTLLVEGEFDCLSIHTLSLLAYGKPTEALCRSGSALNGVALKNLSRLGINEVYVMPDNDEGGVKYIQNILKNKDKLNICIISPNDYKPGEDPCDYARRIGDINKFAEIVKKSKLLPYQWVARTITQNNKDTPEGIITARQEAVQWAREEGLDGVELEDFVKEVASATQSTPEALKEEIQKDTGIGTKIVTIDSKEYLENGTGYAEIKTIIIDREKIPREEQLSNFKLRIDTVISIEEGESQYTGNLIINNENLNFTVGENVLCDNKEFEKAITHRKPTGLYWPDKKLGLIRVLARHFNQEAKTIKGTRTIGYSDNAYITPSVIIKNGIVSPNNEIKFIIDGENSAIKNYDFILTNDKDELKKAANFVLNDFLNLTSHKVTIPLLGQIALAPIRRELEIPPTVLFLEGLTGSWKTVSVKAALNFYADHHMDAGLPSISSTANAIEKMGYYIKDAPFIWDDFKLETKGRDAERVLQNFYDQHGRGRLQRNLQFRPEYYIRGELIVTGEEFPPNLASVLRRSLIIRCEKPLHSTAKIKKFDKNRHCLRMLMPHYIAWVQRNGISYFDGDDMDQTDIAVKANLTALKTFFAFLMDECDISEMFLDNLFKKACEILTTTSAMVKESIPLEHKEIIFMQTIWELLATKQLLLKEPVIELNEKGKKVGFIGKQTIPDEIEGGTKEVEIICIYPTIAINEVERITHVKFSKNSLGRNLKDAGYLVTTENRSSPSQSVWDPEAGKTVSCWVFNKDAFDNKNE